MQPELSLVALTGRQQTDPHGGNDPFPELFQRFSGAVDRVMLRIC